MHIFGIFPCILTKFHWIVIFGPLYLAAESNYITHKDFLIKYNRINTS